MKYIKYLLVLLFLCIALSLVMRYNINSKTPPFILTKLQEFERDWQLMDSIGGFRNFEYSYNKNDFAFRDTVVYRIVLKGKKKRLSYEAVQLKVSHDHWRQIDETLTIE